VKLAVVSCCVLDVCEQLHIFYLGENCSYYAENIRCHSTKFSCLGSVYPSCRKCILFHFFDCGISQLLFAKII
jgi:hypothetical protein